MSEGSHEAGRAERIANTSFIAQRLVAVAIGSVTAFFVLTMLFFLVVRLVDNISLINSAIQVIVVLSGVFTVVGALFGVYLLRVRRTREEQRATVNTTQKTDEQDRKRSEFSAERSRGFAFASPVKSSRERQSEEEQLRNISATVNELQIKIDTLITQKSQEDDRSE